MGLYFFYGDSHYDHSKTLFTIMDLLSKFGGFYGAIFSFLGIIGSFYNSNMFIGQLIGGLYFLKESSEESAPLILNTKNISKNIKKITFSTKDMFSLIKFDICTYLCGKKIKDRK